MSQHGTILKAANKYNPNNGIIELLSSTFFNKKIIKIENIKIVNHSNQILGKPTIKTFFLVKSFSKKLFLLKSFKKLFS